MKTRLVPTLCGVGVLASMALGACDIVSLDPGTPDMSIRLDTTDFERSGIMAQATVSFLIENRGSGSAYLEGCPDPVNMVVEGFDGLWTEHLRLNATCGPQETPNQVTLGGNKAYSYEYVEAAPGHYRLTVRYGREPDAPEQYSVSSPEFDVH